MAKGPIITDTVKRHIARVYVEHPDWRAKEIQRELHAQLCRENPRVTPDWPGLSTVQKELTRIRKTEVEIEPDSEQNPWHVATLAQYDIPAESLPAVLEVYLIPLKMKVRPMTIREAKWVARLYHVIQDPFTLWTLAKYYALDEYIAKITGKGDDIQSYIIATLKLYSNMTEKLIRFKVPGEQLTHDMTGSRRLRSDIQREFTDFFDQPDEKLDWPYIIEVQEVKNERSHNQEIQE